MGSFGPGQRAGGGGGSGREPKGGGGCGGGGWGQWGEANVEYRVCNKTCNCMRHNLQFVFTQCVSGRGGGGAVHVCVCVC